MTLHIAATPTDVSKFNIYSSNEDKEIHCHSDIAKVHVFTDKTAYDGVDHENHPQARIQYIFDRWTEVIELQLKVDEWIGRAEIEYGCDLKANEKYGLVKKVLDAIPEFNPQELESLRTDPDYNKDKERKFIVPAYGKLLHLKTLFNNVVMQAAHKVIDDAYTASLSIKEYDESRDLFEIFCKYLKNCFPLEKDAYLTPAIVERTFYAVVEDIQALSLDLVAERIEKMKIIHSCGINDLHGGFYI
jgi:hypothetical protein